MQHKVLVVDDCQGIPDVLADILRTRGYQVSTATDRYDALTKSVLDRPDLLITDLTMPGMDGYELCRITRGISSVRIMVITAQLRGESGQGPGIFSIAEISAHGDRGRGPPGPGDGPLVS